MSRGIRTPSLLEEPESGDDRRLPVATMLMLALPASAGGRTREVIARVPD